MAKENDYDDLDDNWDDEGDTEQDEDTAPLLDSIDNKDARRRLDDLLEERRLKHEMDDDFLD